ncbi:MULTISPECIES: MFS transporter [unclassified Acidovorax]|uniref:MFS transporter n=1 Tax=unclassified Acidovorax TaxID=2684926 RepID=UPI000ABC14CA|nr:MULTISPECIES: MFS transporter [unclassified Acidovorax]
MPGLAGGAATAARAPHLSGRVVLCLGVSQFICWGISYYLIGALGEAMVQDLGWARTTVHGGFAVALLVMGCVSAAAGRWVDRWGGRRVMVWGSLGLAAGCLGLAAAHGVVLYYAAWAVMGLAMRLTLYDAAFAALAHWAGPHARRPMAQITLLGGLAATAFWPLGHAMADGAGWRVALLVYAGLALLTVPLHLALPGPAAAFSDGDPAAAAALPAHPEPLAREGAERALAAVLFAAMTTLVNFLNAGMSAHLVGLLAGLGLALPLAVGVASLRGVGQSAARVAEVLFGARLHPLALGASACALLPLAFLAGAASGQVLAAAWVFVLLYGACNGLLTIARGTLPLVLFDHRTYGAFVGRLVAPGFVLSACAPVVYAAVMDGYGAAAALWMSVAVAALVCAASMALLLRFGARARSAVADS